MRTRVMTLFLVVVLVAGACGSDDDDSSAAASGNGGGDETETTASGDEPVQGGELTVALNTEPEPIDPPSVISSFGRTVASSIFDTLLTIDEAGNLQPMLATGWDTPDNGKTWVVALREGVTFHDGTALDADTVVAHSQRLMDPATECECLQSIAALEAVEATGPMEVTYSLGAPSASFPATLADSFGMVGAPGTSADHPVGAGPFELSERRDGESITVTAYDGYWQDGLPYLDSIVFEIIPDIDTRIAALRSGELDLFRGVPYTRWTEADDDPALERIEFGGFGSNMIIFNVSEAPFDDLDARYAVSKAIDRKTLHETVNNGAVEPASSIYHRGSWAYPGEIDSYPSYDPDGAEALVDELGGLSFSLLVPNAYADQAVPIQAMLEDAGMSVEINQVENSTAIATYREGSFDATLTGYSARVDPQNFTMAYSSTSFLNFGRFSDPQMDRLVTEADTLIEPEERAAVYAEISERAAELLPFAVINNHNDAYLARAAVQGIPVSPDGILRPQTVWLDE